MSRLVSKGLRRLSGKTWKEDACRTTSTDEPSYEDQCALPLPRIVGKASLGLKDAPGELGVNWDGSLLGLPIDLVEQEREPEAKLRGKRRPHLSDKFYVAFAYDGAGNSYEPFGSDPGAAHRSIIDGYLPGVDLAFYSQKQNLIYKETAFAVPLPGTSNEPIVLAKITVKNAGDCHRKTTLLVQFGWKNRALRKIDRACRQRGRVVYDQNGTPVLLCSQKGLFSEGREHSITYHIALDPGEEQAFLFRVPRTSLAGQKVVAAQKYDFDAALADFKDYWNSILSKGTEVLLPDPMMTKLYRNLIAQCFIAAHGDEMYYGAYPSGYDNYVFGVEEGWSMIALALWGHAEDSKRYITHTYLSREHLDKEKSGHAPVRNGISVSDAYECYRITRDTAWLERVLPIMKECGDWTIAQRERTKKKEDGKRPLHWGLLPKAPLGGDITAPGYPLYSNACCWRGLRDLGLALKDCGYRKEAEYYLRNAAEYKKTILSAVEKILRRELEPSLLPLQLYERRTKRPVSPQYFTTRQNAPPTQGYDLLGDYYQLFAPLILETGVFGYKTELSGIITRYLENSNRLFQGLPRFWGGIDAHYARGYALNKLMNQETEEFLRILYAHLAHSMDREVLTCTEVREFKTGERDREAFDRRYQTLDLRHGQEPCSAGPGVILQYLRYMLVMEEKDEEDAPTGHLLLAYGVPGTWLDNGREIAVRKAPTYFGEISFSVLSMIALNRIQAEIELPAGKNCKGIRLKLRHPSRVRIKKVIVNGRQCPRQALQDDVIHLDRPKTRLRITAYY